VSVDEQYVAFPKLYKAPAYARPPAPVDPSDRPFDPDELPLLAEQMPEERTVNERALPGIALAGALPLSTDARSYVTPQPAPAAPETPAPPSVLAPRPFSLRALADRLRGRSD
jgi:hypothetical protein